MLNSVFKFLTYSQHIFPEHLKNFSKSSAENFVFSESFTNENAKQLKRELHN